jgi:RHS repeat-associated protein
LVGGVWPSLSRHLRDGRRLVHLQPPYGAQTASANNVYSPFAYDSGLNIPGTKLLQFGDRDYSPVRAGWLQLDPTGQTPGYVFANDDPINLSDPSGTSLLGQCAKGAAVGALIGAGGADETGVGLVAATAGGALQGCGQSLAADVVDEATHSLLGTAVDEVSSISDVLKLF